VLFIEIGRVLDEVHIKIGRKWRSNSVGMSRAFDSV